MSLHDAKNFENNLAGFHWRMELKKYLKKYALPTVADF